MIQGGNPAFKMYDVDSETFEIMDVKVYTSECIVSFHWTNADLGLANMSDPTFQSTRK